MKTILFGAGSHLGVSIDGAAYGAEHLILRMDQEDRRLLMQNLNYKKSRDKADLRKNEAEIKAYNTWVYQTMLPEMQNGKFPILIGGDHSVAVASALASAKANGNIGIIWLDAHTDFNTFESTVTGNLHGLPLAAITGYHCEELRSFHNGATINPHKAVIVGARAVDPPEWENLRDAGVTVFTTQDLLQQGVESVMQQAFAIAGAGGDGIHVSYDLDLIDPQVAPGVSVPERDGIHEKEAFAIADFLTSHIRQIVSFDLVELNPVRDIEGKTEALALRILKQILEALHETV